MLCGCLLHLQREGGGCKGGRVFLCLFRFTDGAQEALCPCGVQELKGSRSRGGSIGLRAASSAVHKQMTD